MNLEGFEEIEKKKKKKGQIIWVHGYPCSGKTFTADYLATVGWFNVDGDWIFSATEPEDIEFGKKFGKAFKKVVAEKEMDDEEKKYF
jgi:murein L,D-transpeptidase YafK